MKKHLLELTHAEVILKVWLGVSNLYWEKSILFFFFYELAI